MLKSKLHKQFYIGSTKDLTERLKEHNNGKVFSSQRYKPWVVYYYEAYSLEKLARIREKKLKYGGNAIRELKKRLDLVKSGKGVYPAPLL